MKDDAEKIICGRYALKERLNEGGLGVAYRATDFLLNREVLLKCPLVSDDEHADSPAPAHEFKILSKLRLPNIVKALDYYHESCIGPFFTQELIRGDELKSWAKGKKISHILKIMYRLAGVLEYIHSLDIVHGDVKPSNILITTESKNSRDQSNAEPTLIDFGSARTTGTVSDKGVLGTFHYMAPEHIQTGISLPAGDWYAFGVLFYELLSGCLPFQAETPVELMRLHSETSPPLLKDEKGRMNDSLRYLIARLLQKTPGKRPDATEVKTVICETCLEDCGIDLLQHDHRPVEGDPFVGMEQAINYLVALFRKSKDGQSSSVVIQGDTGSGKTRLIEEFKNRAQLNGGQAFLIRKGLTLSTTEPTFHSVLQILTEAYPDDGESAEVHDAFHEYSEIMNSQQKLPEPTETMESWNPIKLSHDLRLKKSICRIIENAARKKPLVILFDQAENLDADFFHLIAGIADHIRNFPVLLCFSRSSTTRSSQKTASGDFFKKLINSEYCRWITLTGLNRKSILSLIRILCRKEMPITFIDSVAGSSCGNPYLIRLLIEKRLHEQEQDIKTGTEDSYEDLIFNLVDSSDAFSDKFILNLSDAAREMLNYASCMLEGIHKSLLQKILGWTPQKVKEVAGELIRAGFFRYDESYSEYRIPDPFLKVFISRRIPENRLSAVCQTVAEVLENNETYKQWPGILEIAEKFMKAGITHKAILYAKNAGKMSLKRRDYSEAISLLDSVLKMDPSKAGPKREKLELKELMGDIYRLKALPDSALAFYLECEKNTTDKFRKAELLWKISMCRSRKGDWRQALLAAEKAFNTLKECADCPQLVRILNRIGWIYRQTGRHQEAASFFTKASDLAQKTGFTNGLLETCHNLIGLSLHYGDTKKAKYYLKSYALNMKKTSNPAHRLFFLSRQGMLEFLQDRLDAALSTYQQCYALAVKLSDPQREYQALYNIACIYGRKGCFEKSIEKAEFGLNLAGRLRSPRAKAEFLLLKAQGLEKQGFLDQALTCFQECLDSSGNSENDTDKYRIMSYMAVVHIKKGCLEDALNCLQPASEFMIKNESYADIAETEKYMSRLLLERAENDECLTHALKAMKAASKIKNRRATGRILYLMGAAWLRKKNMKKGDLFCRKSLELLAESGDNYELAEACFLIGRTYMELNDDHSAESYFEKAVNSFANQDCLRSLGLLHQYLGDIQKRKQEFKQATNHYRTAGEFFARLDDPALMARNYRLLAQLAVKLGRADKARTYLNRSKELLSNDASSLYNIKENFNRTH